MLAIIDWLLEDVSDKTGFTIKADTWIHMVARITAIIIGLTLLTGCQSATELWFSLSSSDVPRNAREEVIFNYFHALREKRYEDAYKLRYGSDLSSAESVSRFAERHIAGHSLLATEIAVGQERKPEDSSDGCDYTYTVYAKHDGVIVTSGLVAIESAIDSPDVCVISYNSAFGSVP
ncbi:MAG: hypothetical protein ABG776_15750 [Cyanobacteria bacterium J06555_13]